MGYRERQAHRQQQKQQSLGQGYQQESLQHMPAPTTMNPRDGDKVFNTPQVGHRLENVVPSENGLRVLSQPTVITQMAVNASSSAQGGRYGTIVSYQSSSQTSSECYVIYPNRIYDVDAAVGLKAFSTATTYTSISGMGNVAHAYTQFGTTIFAVNSQKAIKWTRASGWTDWSATCSGGDINEMWGVHNFKRRLYAWGKDSSIFWYGSTDQIEGTLNPFDLSYVMSGRLAMMDTITRDGGAGPDDFAVFITDTGNAAVYQGSDPGDATDWSLVGTYKIGKPCGRMSKVQYGQQLVVMCEDDFYFLPEDLAGKRQSTPAADYRQQTTVSTNDRTTGLHWEKEGLLVFSDGSVLDPKQGYAYTHIYLSSASPTTARSWLYASGSTVANYLPPSIAVHEDRLYAAPALIKTTASAASVNAQLWEIDADWQPRKKGVIQTSNFRSPSKTNITLVHPIWHMTKEAPTTANSSVGTMKARIWGAYDKYGDVSCTTSAQALISVSGSADSLYQWFTLPSTNHNAVKLMFQVTTASTSGELYFVGWDMSISDTGGI